jgi:hypothetical protein
MFGRIGGFLRTVLIALLLLCLLAGVAELWLRGRGFPIRTISSQVSDSLQTLLEPSALYHHRLRPVSGGAANRCCGPAWSGSAGCKD